MKALKKAQTRLQSEKARRQEAPDIVTWGERYFNISETGQPIKLFPHQKAVLRYAFQRTPDGHFKYSTIIYSTPKKSGKTTIAGLVEQWSAETWTRYGEILSIGNDAEQAKERAFAKLKQSIELTPGFDRRKNMLPGHWRLGSAVASHIPSGTKVKAVATDYKGEAGGNPTLTVWTELWGFTYAADMKFWAEMAPSPVRRDSVRFIETYAGYEGESELLYNIYSAAVLEGRQLTAGELGDLSAFEEAPNPDSLVPCYVDDQANIFAYWDDGLVARRMPWQKGERGKKYYATEAAMQTPAQMERLHENKWVSPISNFVPIEWWDACFNPLPLRPGERAPLVLALDAGVTGDDFGLIGVSLDPDYKGDERGVAVRIVRKWTPPQGGSIDFDGPKEAVRYICKNWNVLQVAYDQYQLHDFATTLAKEGVAWFRPFSQAQERLVADKKLRDIIGARRIRHDGNQELREHITNANAKQSKDEDTKLRLVKKSENRRIDLAVALSMATNEILRLNIE